MKLQGGVSRKNSPTTSPTLPKEKTGTMKMATGFQPPPGSWWYPAFVSNERWSLRVPIIQLIWGNTAMLCKRLYVAMARNPWRPPHLTPPSLSSPPSPYKAFYTGTLECNHKEKRRRRTERREREIGNSWGGGLNWWGVCILGQSWRGGRKSMKEDYGERPQPALDMLISHDTPHEQKHNFHLRSWIEQTT